MLFFSDGKCDGILFFIIFSSSASKCYANIFLKKLYFFLIVFCYVTSIIIINFFVNFLMEIILFFSGAFKFLCVALKCNRNDQYISKKSTRKFHWVIFGWFTYSIYYSIKNNIFLDVEIFRLV